MKVKLLLIATCLLLLFACDWLVKSINHRVLKDDVNWNNQPINQHV